MAATQRPPESLEAFLARAGLPWFEAVLREEAGVADVTALLQLHAAGTLSEALTEIGIDDKYALAIAAELDKLQAKNAQPAAAAGTPPGASAHLAEAPDASPPTFTAGGIYNPRFLSV